MRPILGPELLLWLRHSNQVFQHNLRSISGKPQMFRCGEDLDPVDIPVVTVIDRIVRAEAHSVVHTVPLQDDIQGVYFRVVPNFHDQRLLPEKYV